MSEKFETLVYEIDRGRARITLNRPTKRNALSFQLQDELHEALWEADNDTEVHGVVLRGAGKSFCAGYDLAPAPGTGPPAGDPDRTYRGYRVIDDDAWHLERRQRYAESLQSLARVNYQCNTGAGIRARRCAGFSGGYRPQ